MPATLAARSSVMRCVVGAVVGDRARAVLLLQAADAVREAGRAGDRPRRARGGRRARRAGTARPRPAVRAEARVDRAAGRPADGIFHGSLELATKRSRQQDHRRAVGDRDPRRLVDGLEALRRARTARSPAAATRRGGRRAPAAGRTARSWSACRSTGRRAGRR